MKSSNPASSAPRLVLGTAGHIDHGKTALVKALTGVDCDRLPEEKDRGITIALGFAPLDLTDELRVSVIDVPGHEGLVRTMVSGATGIDLVLLVVAADEGVMPQTREHLAICDLLGVEQGVVALTKIDLVDQEMQDLARGEVEEALAGTTLEGSPIVPLSSQTGEGVEALKSCLVAAVGPASARTPRSGPPRLAIDRAFASRGFGTVVTGTLIGAPLEVGVTLEVHPSGLRARVRGLQSHGQSADRVEPGARCAVNLQGIDLAQLSRGEVLSAPGALPSTHTLDLRLSWLPEAPPLDASASVEFMVGAARRTGHLVPLGSEVAPGSTGFARMHVEGDPLAVLPGDRFVVRGFARTALGGMTLGGGTLLDAVPPRRRRSDPALLRDLEVLASGDAEAALHVRISRSGFEGIEDASLRRETGLDASLFEQTARELAKRGDAVLAAGRVWLSAAVLSDLETRLQAALSSFHAKEPLRPGMQRGALRGALPENVPPPLAELALERLVANATASVERDLVRLSDHRPSLTQEEEALAERIVSEAREAGLEPSSLRDWGERHGLGPEGLRPLLVYLEQMGRLVRAPGDLWFDAASIADLRERVRAHIEREGSLDTPSYKSLIGTTRRTAVPLMELLDEEHLTLRKGEVRVLRGR